MTDFEEKFYTLLQDFGQVGFDLNKTLHDVPRMLNRIHKIPFEKLKAMDIDTVSETDLPFIAGNFPIHSICQYQNVDVKLLTARCIEKWDEFEKSYWNSSKHPSNDPDHWNHCTFSSFTLDNLENLMKIIETL